MASFFYFFFFLLMVSCASARNVQSVYGKEGIVALHPALFGSAEDEAYELMDKNCGARKWKILKEQEAISGSQGTYTATHAQGLSRAIVGDGTSRTSNTYEKQLYYKCVKK